MEYDDCKRVLIGFGQKGGIELVVCSIEFIGIGCIFEVSLSLLKGIAVAVECIK